MTGKERNQIDPRALLTFHTVCECGSISAAARAMNISQPSVSAAIAQLEARLGVRLFERSRTGILLSAAGEALRFRAAGLHTLLANAAGDVDLVRQGYPGPLRIGGTPGALVSLLPDALARLEARMGPLPVSIVERSDTDLVTMLLDGQIELAFVTTGIGTVPEGIEERTLSQDRFALITGPACQDLPDRVSLADVGDLPWVLPHAKGAFRRQVDALFIAAQVAEPLNVIRCDSLLTTKAIVRGSSRITILPREVVAPELASGALRALEIKDSSLRRKIGIRTVMGAELTRGARDLLAELASNP